MRLPRITRAATTAVALLALACSFYTLAFGPGQAGHEQTFFPGTAIAVGCSHRAPPEGCDCNEANRPMGTFVPVPRVVRCAHTIDGTISTSSFRCPRCGEWTSGGSYVHLSPPG